MKYPTLTIDTTKFKQNLNKVYIMAKENGVTISVVTKGFCALPELTKLCIEAGFCDLADSRLENLKKIDNHPGIRKWLLRLPMISEAKEVITVADISLNSEIDTIQALGTEAVKLGKCHGVVLMIELGDLREGILVQDAVAIAGEILKINGIKLLGIGVNFNCFGGIIPTNNNLKQLVCVAADIERTYGIKLDIISGGNSGSAYLLENNLPTGINHLRLGEVVLLGKETSFQHQLWDLHTDIFTLHTEIIELKEKPSMPYGESGLDAFGEKPIHVDKGPMKRAIIACGRQDVNTDKIIPHDEQIHIIGASSDHILLDVTHTDKDYRVGDIVTFKVNYASLLSLSTSVYIEKMLVY
ncbi:alanine/ornithine racemase family PLP-dependent enzyme [Bacteroides sp. 519]|uniref:alanine/ornithine racemase family PLP-dependent enzyme n=1 Tax=Bacteroides sp. 519 TaxID=2302937 RepID=UPI0013D61838|nr:alanine/ornithine racemase family PLP-dependent enzyme [Bacteroides sp. 519]NDV59260.1 alanine/ornithine racemase family PLP-dependent enzyme [Bacteroides sp. 519]